MAGTPFTALDIIALTNEYRRSQNLPPLKVNETLMKAAQARADDMSVTGNFSHSIATTTAMNTPYAFMDKAGYKRTYAGENLAEGYKTAAETLKAWRESATHNENLLNTKYSEIGVAIVPGKYKGKSTNFTIQFFATPAATSTAKASSTPITKKEVKAIVIPKKKVVEPAKEVPIPKKFTPAKLMPLSFKNSNSTIPKR